jgi:hypothetical protein
MWYPGRNNFRNLAKPVRRFAWLPARRILPGRLAMPVDSSGLVELTSLRKAAAGRRGSLPRKRILVINCYLPEVREPVRLKYEVPNTLAPILLGGAFSPTNCEIRLYNEVSSGVSLWRAVASHYSWLRSMGRPA